MRYGGSLDPELWELTGNPWLILQSVSQETLDSLSDSAFRERVETTPGGTKRRKLHEVVSDGPSGFAAADGRILQHGVYAQRSPADLLGWPGQCRRRSTEISERSGRACHRRRSAVSAGLFSAGNRQSRRTTGALPRQRAGAVAHQAGADY